MCDLNGFVGGGGVIMVSVVVILVVEVLLTFVVLVAWWQLLLTSYFTFSLARVVYICGIKKTTQSFVTFPA